MLDRTPASAGIRYNLALAHARAAMWEKALDIAQDALADSSNYQPAANLVAEALTELGDPEQAERFHSEWRAIPNNNDE